MFLEVFRGFWRLLEVFGGFWALGPGGGVRDLKVFCFLGFFQGFWRFLSFRDFVCSRSGCHKYM